MTLKRPSGVLVPLFSVPSSDSWGIGEFGDLPVLADWLRHAGLGFLQLLPLNETAIDESSPYSPLTAMALDPQFISLRHVEDFVAIGGETSLDDAGRRGLAQARDASRIDYRRVREVKDQALRRAFDRFVEAEWEIQGPRARALQQYVSSQSWWIEAYGLFRALRAAHSDRSWRAWPDPVRRADPDALVSARSALARQVLFYQYLQWIAEGQWQAARRASQSIAIFGDFPFLVTLDSADVWIRQHEFLLDATAGAPPDAFSETGQDWGLPPYNWEVIAARGDDWVRQRARRMAALYDGYRVDHLVGFYRTYVRPRAGVPYFSPPAEPDQLAQGERLMSIFLESGARVTVEDLGNVPPFVRQSLARLGLPGYAVLRWAREWDSPGQPFRDPATYPSTSVATTGTHDTETLAEWWESISPEERAEVAALPTIIRLTAGRESLARSFLHPKLDETTRDVLVETMYSAGSDLLILPIQDVFGWRPRINEPGTVSDANWTFKLPWPVDRLMVESEPLACAERLRVWAERHGRL